MKAIVVLGLIIAVGVTATLTPSSAEARQAGILKEGNNAYRNPEDVKAAPRAIRKACIAAIGVPKADDPQHWGSPEITACIRAGGPGHR
ncbi:hypothetical protein EYW49_07925 [Siculibacillus lacustris]|uniref:Uncharacterized protein n=1 Tax=Siculibacillus lacustris TaxID=1549641 RepID=A0A4Q9VTU6_9HYPH|nr:hypothetical protein [Siculibacillus lacustris]TBW39049.1 hypothetical protein EYW49_07925 [Siculibacillus lacustris]